MKKSTIALGSIFVEGFGFSNKHWGQPIMGRTHINLPIAQNTPRNNTRED
jgi:hypothetical protein